MDNIDNKVVRDICNNEYVELNGTAFKRVLLCDYT